MMKLFTSLSVIVFSIFVVTGSAHGAVAAAAAGGAGAASCSGPRWTEVPEGLRTRLEAYAATVQDTETLVSATYKMYTQLTQHFSPQVSVQFLIQLKFIENLCPFMTAPPESADMKDPDAFMGLLFKGSTALVNTSSTRRGYSGDEAVYPIQLAVESERVDYVAALLDNGALPNVVDSKASPLWHAVGRGLHGAVVRLLRAGADVNAQTADGITPLMLAAGAGDERMADILLAANARTDFKDDKRGWKASDHAYARGHHDLAAYLIGFIP